MQTLRRWVPRPARPAITESEPPAPPAVPLRPGDIAGKHMAFCAEFAVHGGVAASAEGFRAEGELLRMQRAGLLDLQRDTAPPFAVIRVALSDAARAMLAGSPARREGPVDASPTPRPVADPGQNPRRHGFEVARGIIGAGVKAELAAWSAQGQPGGTAALEARMLSRISQLQAPFPL
jgi:hypothetical protein